MDLEEPIELKLYHDMHTKDGIWILEEKKHNYVAISSQLLFYFNYFFIHYNFMLICLVIGQNVGLVQ